MSFWRVCPTLDSAKTYFIYAPKLTFASFYDLNNGQKKELLFHTIRNIWKILKLKKYSFFIFEV